MYQGRFEPARRACEPRRRGGKGRMTMMVLSTLLLLALAIGGTVAWLTTNTEGITNTFTPSQVSCKVDEKFDGKIKESVRIQNTSDIEAFIRVKVIAYRTNKDGQHIGGYATVPAESFSNDESWFLKDGYYYYKNAVASKDYTGILINKVDLTTPYTDPDGGYLAIDVMAEAIQSVPVDAVKAAWNVSVDANGNLSGI